jgi:pimeloyl-ACP methyl ester carboxylesterase
VDIVGPEFTPLLTMVSANGVDIAAWVWPGDDPPLLFAHATGFHGRAWDVIARALPGRRRIAVEVRGHGRSSKPEPPYLWRDFGRDIVAVAEALDVHDALGVGHSMGGHSTVCAAALRPKTYAELLLIDPTIMSRELYGTAPPDASYIAKRRNVFPSAEAMIERFQNRLPFSRWHPQVLRDYCEFGILPSGGEFVLACPPDIEASIYHESRVAASNIYPEIERIRQPVTVIRAGKTREPGVFDLSTSPTAPDLAAHFPHARDMVFANCTHYIPMEAPERIAASLTSPLPW